MNIDKEKFDVAVGSLVMLEVMFRNRGEPLFADRVRDSKLLFEALEKEESPISALQARVEALEGAVTKSVNLFKEIANDTHCDNDGRGCGSGSYSHKLAVELEAILKGEK